MRHVKVHEAKTQLSKLLVAVERGEHVIIERGNDPVARLVPFDATRAPRRVGFLAGSIELPEDLERRLNDNEVY